jgi:hypothetical protein
MLISLILQFCAVQGNAYEYCCFARLGSLFDTCDLSNPTRPTMTNELMVATLRDEGCCSLGQSLGVDIAASLFDHLPAYHSHNEIAVRR